MHIPLKLPQKRSHCILLQATLQVCQKKFSLIYFCRLKNTPGPSVQLIPCNNFSSFPTDAILVHYAANSPHKTVTRSSFKVINFSGNQFPFSFTQHDTTRLQDEVTQRFHLIRRQMPPIYANGSLHHQTESPLFGRCCISVFTHAVQPNTFQHKRQSVLGIYNE